MAVLLPPDNVVDANADASAKKKKKEVNTSFSSSSQHLLSHLKHHALKKGLVPTGTTIPVLDLVKMKMRQPGLRPKVGFRILHPSKVPKSQKDRIGWPGCPLSHRNLNP